MNNYTIARKNYSLERMFPGISEYIGQSTSRSDSGSDHEKTSMFPLDFQAKKLSWGKRIFGWKLDSNEKYSRLMHLYNHAIQAELAEKWQRAQFFWVQTHNLLKKLLKDNKAWKDLVKTSSDDPSINVTEDINRLKKIFVCELFIDTHCAFYNGYIEDLENTKNRDRACQHVGFLEKLLPYSDLTNDEQTYLLEPAINLCYHVSKEKEDWTKAYKDGEILLSLSPHAEEYQNKLADIISSETIAKVADAQSEAMNLKNAKIIKNGIDRLIQLKSKYVYNIYIYQHIGNLYYLQSIQLFNGKEYSEGLLSAQKSLTYWPYLEEAEKIRDEYMEIMHKIQTHMQDVLAEKPGKAKAAFTPKDQKLKLEAEKGFNPLNAYIKSIESGQVVDEFIIAQARRIWTDFGLEIPEDGWNEKANSLINATDNVLTSPPEDMNDLRNVWTEIASSDNYLATLDSEKVCSYLTSRLTNKPFKNSDTKAKSPPAQFPIIMTQVDATVHK